MAAAARAAPGRVRIVDLRDYIVVTVRVFTCDRSTTTTVLVPTTTRLDRRLYCSRLCIYSVHVIILWITCTGIKKMKKVKKKTSSKHVRKTQST